MDQFISEMYGRNIELINKIVELQEEKLSIIILFSKEFQGDNETKQRLVNLNNELIEIQEELNEIEKETIS